MTVSLAAFASALGASTDPDVYATALPSTKDLQTINTFVRPNTSFAAARSSSVAVETLTSPIERVCFLFLSWIKTRQHTGLIWYACFLSRIWMPRLTFALRRRVIPAQARERLPPLVPPPTLPHPLRHLRRAPTSLPQSLCRDCGSAGLCALCPGTYKGGAGVLARTCGAGVDFPAGVLCSLSSHHCLPSCVNFLTLFFFLIGICYSAYLPNRPLPYASPPPAPLPPPTLLRFLPALSPHP